MPVSDAFSRLEINRRRSPTPLHHGPEAAVVAETMQLACPSATLPATVALAYRSPREYVRANRNPPSLRSDGVNSTDRQHYMQAQVYRLLDRSKINSGQTTFRGNPHDRVKSGPLPTIKRWPSREPLLRGKAE